MEEIVLCPIKTIGWDNFWSWAQGGKNYAELVINFIYSEKATKFCETSTVNFSYVVTVKSMVEVSQNFQFCGLLRIYEL